MKDDLRPEYDLRRMRVRKVGPERANVEVAFAEIRDEFNQTFSYIRQDIIEILKKNPSLHYTLLLLGCCACEMLAYHKDLQQHQVFTSLLPDSHPYPVIGKSMWKALRHGLAHKFRPRTIKIGSHQWRFSICHSGPLVKVIAGDTNWLQMNVKALNERVKAKIDAYEEELRQKENVRIRFREKSASTIREIPGRTAEAKAWNALLPKKQ